MAVETQTVRSFKVGERVVRTQIFANNKVNFRRGVIIDIYQGISTNLSPGVTMYKVRWDDTGLIEQGYFSNGLMPEPLSVGGLGL